MTELNPKFLEQITKINEVLDSLDYFQLLRVTAEADPGEIRAAYHKQAKMYHPDRYHYLASDNLSQMMTRISKRITEAYVILRDHKKRDQYKTRLQGEERAKHLRYQPEQQEEERKKQEAELGKTPQVRQMHTLATNAWKKGNKPEALKSLRMALVYESDNEHFQELLAEWTSEGEGS